MRRITSSKEATGKIKSSFELILLTVSDRRPQCSRGLDTDYSTRSKETEKIAFIRRHNQEAERKQRNDCAILVPKDRRDEPKQPTARTADTRKWL